ncbi:hypothetical protein GCM10009677_43700 [Sphaerisporangium rubeum]
MTSGQGPAKHPAIVAAYRLRHALESHGIAADVNEGDGIALVSVWHDLLVWCGPCFLWWAGEVSPTNGRNVYRYSPANDPVTAARRIAARYDQLRRITPADVPAPRSGHPL